MHDAALYFLFMEHSTVEAANGSCQLRLIEKFPACEADTLSPVR